MDYGSVFNSFPLKSSFWSDYRLPMNSGRSHIRSSVDWINVKKQVLALVKNLPVDIDICLVMLQFQGDVFVYFVRELDP